MTKFLFEMTKKLSQFGHNVWKDSLANVVTARFTTIMGQMTKMS